VRSVATRKLLTSFRGVVPPCLVAFPRVVAACASANARPTTWILGGACSPRTLGAAKPARSCTSACRSRASFRRLRRVSSSRSPPSVLRLGRPLPTPCRNKASSAPRCHPHGSRSALVVSHHLDGFLRPDGADIVAVRCRSWGSPCFLDHSPVPAFPKDRVPAGLAVPHDALTPRSCSLSAAPAPSPRAPRRGPCTRSPLPPCRFDRLRGFALQTGLLSSSTVSGDR